MAQEINPMKPTKWIDRFSEAIALLCGAKPPEHLVKEWLDHTDDPHRQNLQDWAACKTPLQWSQGIQVIDAAHALADNPEEGCDHERRQ